MNQVQILAFIMLFAYWVTKKVMLFLAVEQRHELLTATVADGTTTGDAIAEFRNRSASVMHIRSLFLTATSTASGPAEGIVVELSKAPTFQSNTNNSPFFVFHVQAETGPTGATPVDGSIINHRGKRWGKGMLTLEPNESLFMNMAKTSGGLGRGRGEIEYEFA